MLTHMKPINAATDAEIQAALIAALNDCSDEVLIAIDRSGCRCYMDAGDIEDVVISLGPPDNRAMHEHMATRPVALDWVSRGIEANPEEQADAPAQIMKDLMAYLEGVEDSFREQAEALIVDCDD